MTKKRFAIRVVLGLFVLWLGVVAWGFLVAWRPLALYTPRSAAMPVEPILTERDYESNHREPYIVRADDSASRGAVLIWGASHVNDPNHPSLQSIRDEFDDFSPTVVLCEGRMTGLLFPGLMDPVATFGEPGLARQLAYQQGCQVYTWEPPESSIVQGLLDQSFTKQQIALRVILTPYFSNLRFGTPDNPDAFVLDSIRVKKSWPVIGILFSTAADIDKAWDQEFPDGPDWRDLSDQYSLPGFIHEMDINQVRDLHLFSVIGELVEKGERVFVIAGSSHAVKLENAIHSSIK